MLKNMLKLGTALDKAEQKQVNGGGLKAWCQGGGDPECCGTGPGQCGVGHCAGGSWNGYSCMCF